MPPKGIEQLPPDTEVPNAWPVAILERRASEFDGIEWVQQAGELGPSYQAVLQGVGRQLLYALHAYAEAPDVVVFGDETTPREDVAEFVRALGVDAANAKDSQGQPLFTETAIREPSICQRTLEAVNARPGITVREVADDLGVSPGGSFYRVIVQLQRQGRITKEGRELRPVDRIVVQGGNRRLRKRTLRMAMQEAPKRTKSS